MKKSLALPGAGTAFAPGAPRPAPDCPTLDVRFLDAARAQDAKSWLELWEGWPDREVMAHPRFVRLFARPGDQVVCAAARTPSGGVLYPLIVRPIAGEPWAAGQTRGCDLTAAYGYGGPFAWSVTEAEARAFWAAFDAWARSRGAISSFARLPLFPDQALPFAGEILDRGPNVVRTLDLAESELRADYAPKVRKNLRRARSEGVVVGFDPRGRRLDEFLAIYDATMDRRHALPQYYFPREFFESIVAGLPGRFLFAHAMASSKIVSSELILLSGRRAYFFLGGTLAEYFRLRPNELLKHESFLFCAGMGLREFVLGGAYRSEDGVLRYKRAFAPTGELPFRIGVRTYDPDAVARLVESRRAWERSQGRDWVPAPCFFPPYRS